MRTLTVLHDGNCELCQGARRWLSSQPQLVQLRFAATGSPLARELFPGLETATAREEVTAVSDEGAVYRGHRAWLVCLWALRDYREMSLRLGTPEMLPLVRSVIAAVSRHRGRLGLVGRLLGGAPS